mmetsp:Transcript_29062/g.53481  ORF Transcript_29062/g.53481 Transcript_29062/m.53481 type:complete len:340 (-) Transcript_29062:364-1383(-)
MDSFEFGVCLCLVASLFFGSDLLPAKKFDCGDGIFFSCCMALGIWLTGLFVDQALASEAHHFEPLAMLGGAIWFLGNMLAIMSSFRIGLSLQYLVGGTTNMLTGWATGHFGLFGVAKEELSNPTYNWMGLGMLTIGLAFLAQVSDEACTSEKTDDLLVKLVVEPSTPADEVRCGPKGKANFLLGFLMALASGFFFGSNFDIPVVLQQQGPSQGHSAHAMDYAFSHYCGILAMSAVSVLIYVGYMKQHSFVRTELILPAILSGIMWGVSQAAWFKANALLSLSVTFPIINTLTPLIGTFWGAALFGELRQKRNLLIVSATLLTQIPGILLVASSRKFDSP